MAFERGYGVVKNDYNKTSCVRKFGYNPDVDATEDVWDGGGTYTWPSAAATTTIVSSNTNGADDAAEGTGARTVNVFGLDADGLEISETATMNGTNAVTLTNSYYRVYRAYVLTAGSGGTNAGDIQVKHGSTVLAQINVGNGQTLMAIYTVPANKTGYIMGYYASVGKSNTTGAVNLRIWTRANGEGWRNRHVVGLQAAGTSAIEQEMYFPIKVEPLADIRIAATSSANDMEVSAGFDVELIG